jgi:DnaJ-class molecular chaperone
MHITLRDSLLGFKKVLKHLDDRELLIVHNGIMNPHTTKRIVGEGFKNIQTNQKGDLFIKFIVDFPLVVENPELLDKALPKQPPPKNTNGNFKKVVLN